jgi:DHA1 family tetracycline resistance protein-like MFS transporter
MKSSKALIFIFITLLLDCMGLGIIIPTLPGLIQELSGTQASVAASTSGWLQFSYAIMAFVFAPIQGALSDRFGRRPVLLISLAGFGLDYLLLYWAPDLKWLFVGRIAAGICGASFTTASAYIADISTSENRAQNFGLIGAAFGLGFILGPVLGSLLSHWGLRTPFLLAAFVSLINLGFGIFVLPESLSVEHRKPLQIKSFNPFQVFYYLFSKQSLWPFLLVFFLMQMAGQVMPSTWTFFCIERVHWNAEWIGYSLGFVGILVSVVQGGLIGFFKRTLGTLNSIYLGLIGNLCGMLLYSMANQSWMLFAWMLPYALGGLILPNVQSQLSGSMPSNEQGLLQGGLSGLIGITSILAPLIMTHSFTWGCSGTLGFYFPGMAFAVGALFTGLALVVTRIYLKPSVFSISENQNKP